MKWHDTWHDACDMRHVSTHDLRHVIIHDIWHVMSHVVTCVVCHVMSHVSCHISSVMLSCVISCVMSCHVSYHDTCHNTWHDTCAMTRDMTHGQRGPCFWKSSELSDNSTLGLTQGEVIQCFYVLDLCAFHQLLCSLRLGLHSWTPLSTIADITSTNKTSIRLYFSLLHFFLKPSG